MSVPIDLAELARTAAKHDFAYLVTTTEDGRAHLVAVQPVVEDRMVRVACLGRRTLANASARPQVTLAWPPRAAGGHSLFVDGTAEVRPGDDGDIIMVSPSRAVLHRPAPSPSPTDDPSACVSDCVELPVAGTASS
ncbi:MAG: pyridoxamine 5'-phosphate oxidase family protein [Intrasporangium sp.]|uniref:pyridoxamine 5'-phosphate oxidase family protein n=1 Tax=Intrasporangium sp. TaxID=1925024 RepID=UPI0026497496|nr:pyridoxamine 5'-phosphate oxidase family protein [Intrasporangium sp.]MDN5795293.1 pyridoxamine 5'-phosphate oxidase family protein [Intrasporangium sp.]